MPVPVDSNAISLPVQLGTFVGIFLAVLVPAVRAFISAYRAPDRSSEHVVLEAAELADLRDIRLLAQQMRGAIEKTDEIHDLVRRIDEDLQETRKLVIKIDREAEIARRVREELRDAVRRDRRNPD